MNENNTVAAIDIGSAHIIAALANISPKGDVLPIAYVELPSKGIKKGNVNNIGLVQHAIDTALNELRLMGDFHIHSIIASLSGVTTVGQNIEGSASVRGQPAITEENIRQTIACARDAASIQDHQILHILRQSFIVDRLTDIQDPTGMMGEKLTTKVHVISIEKSNYYNLLHAFTKQSAEVDNVVANALASTLAATTHEERQLGVCMLDIGAGTTDMCIVQHGVIKHTEVIQLGGELITNDIAFFMRSTIDTAETIKRQINVSSCYLEHEIIEIAGIGGNMCKYPKHDISDIVRQRCYQIIDKIMEKYNYAGLNDAFPAGFVLCGGTANLAGFDKLLAQGTQMPVRVASIDINLPNNKFSSTHLATIMGLFLCAREEDYTRTMTNDAKTGIISVLKIRFDTIVEKLREYF